MAIYITGDIYGNPKQRFLEPFSALTADDIVIECSLNCFACIFLIIWAVHLVL
jgi:hypothetical protein